MTDEEKTAAIEWAANFIAANMDALDPEFRREMDKAAADAMAGGVGVMFDGKRVNPSDFFKRGKK